MNKKSFQIVLPVILGLVLALGMQIGIKFSKVGTGTKSVISRIATPSKETNIDDIIQFINNRYLDTVNNSQLREVAIQSIFDNLDPFSAYIPPRDLKTVNESLEGKFEGIGIEFYIVNDTITVVTPISGGPSEALGILSGDKIIKIDSINVAGINITNQDVIDKLRGEKGTEVNVEIQRNGNSSLISFDIIRDKIPIYSVDISYMVDDSTGYLKINRFSSSTYEEFRKGMQSLIQSGMKQLILDLRQNPGGFLTAATMIADDFISGDNLIVYTEGLNAKRNDFYAGKTSLFEEGKLIVMIDEGSASASEIVSGAIQDWDRGLIVGHNSFGKGLVQEQYPLKDGSALRLTVAKYYTPSGRCIQRPFKENSKGIKYHDGYSSIDSSIYQDTFYTSKGKEVFASGGIVPNITLKRDSTPANDFLVSVLIKGVIPQFIYGYYANHKEKLMFSSFKEYKDQFFISDDLFNEFVQFAEEKGVKDFPSDIIAKSKKKIKTRLKAYIAKQMWQSEGFYPIIHEIDDDFQQTYQILSSYTDKPVN